jgi:hypothetical protein
VTDGSPGYILLPQKSEKLKLLITTILLVLLYAGTAEAQYRPSQFLDISMVTINEFNSNIGIAQVHTAYSHSSVGFTTIEGIQFNRISTVGVGTGISFYNGGPLIPLFLDYRFNFYNHLKSTTYLYGDGGWLFKASSSLQYTKLFINPGLGLKYELGPYMDGNLDIGVLVQQGERRDTFLNIKAGISFVAMKLHRVNIGRR